MGLRLDGVLPGHRPIIESVGDDGLSAIMVNAAVDFVALDLLERITQRTQLRPAPGSSFIEGRKRPLQPWSAYCLLGRPSYAGFFFTAVYYKAGYVPWQSSLHLCELARVPHQYSRGAQEPLRCSRAKAVNIAAVALAEGAARARRAAVHPASPFSLDCWRPTTPAGSGPGSAPGRSVQARRFTRRVHRADRHFCCPPLPVKD
jgi:hypothetical protein